MAKYESQGYFWRMQSLRLGEFGRIGQFPDHPLLGTWL
jgi:hypothetical protein